MDYKESYSNLKVEAIYIIIISQSKKCNRQPHLSESTFTKPREGFPVCFFLYGISSTDAQIIAAPNIVILQGAIWEVPSSHRNNKSGYILNPICFNMWSFPKGINQAQKRPQLTGPCWSLTGRSSAQERLPVLHPRPWVPIPLSGPAAPVGGLIIKSNRYCTWASWAKALSPSSLQNEETELNFQFGARQSKA